MIYESVIRYDCQESNTQDVANPPFQWPYRYHTALAESHELMSYVASFLDSLFPQARQGTYGCSCGAVRVELCTPFSSYGLVEQTTALCHCRDCVGFVKILGMAGGDNAITIDLEKHKNCATQLVQFYKSDLKVVRGRGHIGSMKIREDTVLVRCYCRQCMTPLGAEVIGCPVILLYADLIRGENYPIFLPRLVLNFGSAGRGSRPYDRNTVVRQGLGAPWFYCRVVARILLGFLFGKDGPAILNGNYESAPLGIESIQTNIVTSTKHGS